MTGGGQLHGILSILSARRMAGPAIQRFLRVIHKIVTQSRTVVHITYYTANVARQLVEKEATCRHAV